ncbi:MAG: hypothetical protein HOF45_00490 [Candidatus Marinimicrobia bacterium]|jgi:hypothetical protein|nr:hypothetical protein [Candidatus Neomarinimicrobiota bacterium]
MTNIIELSSTLYYSLVEILSHLWVYVFLWLSQFFVVWVYLKKMNKSIADVSGVIGKFRIFFLIALLIGFYLGSTIG